MTAIYNWTVNQGETSKILYTRKDSLDAALPFNVGTTFRMKVKTAFDAASAELDLGVGDGWFDLDPSDLPPAEQGRHNVRFTISATDTAGLTSPARMVYDIEAVEGTTITRILEGSFITRPEVTT